MKRCSPAPAARPTRATIERRSRTRVEAEAEETMKMLLGAALGVRLLGCAAEKGTGDWVEQLRDKHTSRRLEAIKALRGRSTEAATVVPALTRALKDQSAFVRRDAAEALGDFS